MEEGEEPILWRYSNRGWTWGSSRSRVGSECMKWKRQGSIDSEEWIGGRRGESRYWVGGEEGYEVLVKGVLQIVF